MNKILRYSWIAFLDILAIALLIIALLFGWLPGAPGIPIALAGLGLLAINHEWARNLLKKLRAKFDELKNKIRNKNQDKA